MKIGIISTIHAPWGGSEEIWFDLAYEALKAGHQVEVSMIYTGKISPKVQQLIGMGLVLHKRRGFIQKGIRRKRRILLKVLNYVRNLLDNPYNPIFAAQPDVVIHNGSLYQVSEDKFLSKMLDTHSVPLIIVTHIIAEFGRKMSNELMQRLRKDFNRAKKVLFVSRRNLENASRQISATIANGEVITNPVNMSDYSIIDYPSTENEIRFATVGNLLVDHKGQDLLLEALGDEKWKSRNWHLDIYGRGQDEEYLKDLCRLYRLEDKVTFKGFEDDVRKIWAEHHMLIMPSLMEGMPLTVVEAMLCGRPVLATDVGGHRELISEGIEGFIAAAPVKFAIDKALEAAWERKGDWAKMGEMAHFRAKGFFNPEIGRKFLAEVLDIAKTI